MKVDDNMKGRKVITFTNGEDLTLTGLLKKVDDLLALHDLEILVSNQGMAQLLVVAIEPRAKDDPQVVGVDTLSVGSKLGA